MGADRGRDGLGLPALYRAPCYGDAVHPVPPPPMLPLPRAMLIDLDDTLLASSAAGRHAMEVITRQLAGDTALPLARVSEAMAEAHTWFWSDEERRTHARLHQAGARARIVERALELIGFTAPVDAEALGHRFLAERLRSLEPIAGALETVVELRRRGVRLALVTNGSAADQRAKIGRHAVDRRFDAVLVEGEVGFGKPDPRIFRLALERLGVTAAEAWMVGDDLPWDIAGAQAVGIHGVWASDHAETGATGDGTVQPDRTVGTIAELLA